MFCKKVLDFVKYFFCISWDNHATIILKLPLLEIHIIPGGKWLVKKDTNNLVYKLKKSLFSAEETRTRLELNFKNSLRFVIFQSNSYLWH